MSPMMVSCPACQTSLRLPGATPAGRVRCPKCKDIFAPIVLAEEYSESVAVVLDSKPASVVPPRDPDDSFFEKLADLTPPIPPLAPFEVVEPQPESRKPPQRRERPIGSGNGLTIAIVALVAIGLLGGLAGAGYLVYAYWSEAAAAAAGTPDDETKPDDKAKPDPKLPDAALAKVKAATILVRSQHADGWTTSASGFFVQGSGLVLTKARSVGQGKKPVQMSRIQVVLGSRTLAARMLGSDAELDLALLQVVGIDLPDGLPLGTDTFALKELQSVVAFGVPSDGDSKSAVGSNAAIAGQRSIAGTRPWYTLSGRVPESAYGGPVTDPAGRVIGVAGVIPGSDTVSAVPAETALAFVQNAVKSVESNGPVAEAPVKKKPREEFDDGPFPDLVRPGGPMPGPPNFPPRFDVPGAPFPGFPPGVNPGFPPPIMPPGFGRPGMRPAGPPKPKVSFPAVEPVPLAPVPLDQDRVELKLPGKVVDTCTGGGGRYWFLYIPTEKQIAVFDTAAAKIVKSIPVSDNVMLAAGMHKLVVAGVDGQLTRYDLKTFEAKPAGKLPFDGTVRQLAMGSASAGPLFVSYHLNEAGRFRTVSYALLDLETFKELEPGPANGAAPMGFQREPMQYRASPDGRTIASFGGGEHFWHVYSLAENGAAIKTNHEPGITVLPGDDGRLFATNAVYASDLRLIGRKEPAPTLRIPAQQGPFFLSFTPERDPNNPFPNPNREFDGPAKLALNLPNSDRPIAVQPDPGVAIPLNFGWQAVTGLPADRRFFFSPAAQLIGFVSGDDKLVLVLFNPDSAVEKSGADYLYVTSRPPLAVRGTTYKYNMMLKSKVGGAKVRIDAGPPGMRAEGTTLVWDVPQRGAIGSDRILVTVTDAGGQEITHAFALSMKE